MRTYFDMHIPTGTAATAAGSARVRGEVNFAAVTHAALASPDSC